VIVHKSALVGGEGAPGEVIEAEADRLVVAAGTGAIRLLLLQLAGKRPVSAAEFLRGHRLQRGDRLGG
jgi:methionyl-tRNA formyltransferase